MSSTIHVTMHTKLQKMYFLGHKMLFYAAGFKTDFLYQYSETTQQLYIWFNAETCL